MAFRQTEAGASFSGRLSRIFRSLDEQDIEIVDITGMHFFAAFAAAAKSDRFETDIIGTSYGRLQITFLGHASLEMDFHDKHIYIDPCTEVADFSKMPKADIILFTHKHSDHFDLNAIEQLKDENTLVVLTEACAAKYGEGIVMKNEDVKIVQGIKIEGVPAYNIVHKLSSGFPYHLKGVGNGYVITFGDKRVYIAGDTEKIPEMDEVERNQRRISSPQASGDNDGGNGGRCG